MKKTLFIIITLSLLLSSCMLLNRPSFDSHTVTIRLPGSAARFVTGAEAQDYTRFYQVRLYPYQNGAIMKIPSFTTVIPAGNDVSFTADTGYYYLELDAWAEKTGTVVTGRGSTLTTESFDDGIATTPIAGVFDLSPEIGEKTVDVVIKAVPDSELPVWKIKWELNGGSFTTGYTAPASYTWKTMYPDPSNFEKSTNLPVVTDVTKAKSSLSGWYLESDFSGTPITKLSQLPLQDTTLYAKWNDAININAVYDGLVTKEITLTESRGELHQFITVTATGISPDDVVTWFINGEAEPEFTGSTITYNAEEKGLYTFTCIAENENGSSSASIDVEVTRIENPEYTITFNAMGGTTYEQENFALTYFHFDWESIRDHLLPSPERERYSFEGWYLTENFTGSPVTSIGDLPVRQDSTLYAKWHANTGIEAGIEIPEEPDEIVIACISDEDVQAKVITITGTGSEFVWYLDGVAVTPTDVTPTQVTITITNPGVHTIMCVADGTSTSNILSVTYIEN